MLIHKKLDDMLWEITKAADKEKVDSLLWDKMERHVARSLEASDLAGRLFGALWEKLDDPE